jgi:GPI inositol-deacylase
MSYIFHSRKGIDNDNWFPHLDFFTVDLNEEYAALFGGVLEDQTKFIEHCIRAILKLYRDPPAKIVIVGHSIGGKIAQKLLTNPDTASLINTIVALATPMEPVLNWDEHINSFYQTVDEYWMENRLITDHENNTCCKRSQTEAATQKHPLLLDDKLLITIGGGNRDLLVRSGLTDSKFSDIHVMTTAIPKVWVEADHLCIVWCLQLVLVLNRFLYSIIIPSNYKDAHSGKGLNFIESKTVRLEKAEHFFLGSQMSSDEISKKRILASPTDSDWIEDNRRIFTETFKTGIKRPRIQMLRLVDNALYHSAHIDVINKKSGDWIFGCEAIETTGTSRYCSQATPIRDHLSWKIPSNLKVDSYPSILCSNSRTF